MQLDSNTLPTAAATPVADLVEAQRQLDAAIWYTENGDSVLANRCRCNAVWLLLAVQ
jgi:hypothetical protein